MGLGIIRLQLQGLVEAVNRFIRPSQVCQDNSQVMMRLREVRQQQ